MVTRDYPMPAALQFVLKDLQKSGVVVSRVCNLMNGGTGIPSAKAIFIPLGTRTLELIESYSHIGAYSHFGKWWRAAKSTLPDTYSSKRRRKANPRDRTMYYFEQVLGCVKMLESV